MFIITGSENRDDEGAPLFTVRVDGVVRRLPIRLIAKTGSDARFPAWTLAYPMTALNSALGLAAHALATHLRDTLQR